MATRFLTHEIADGEQSITDIIELADAGDDKATRRRLMKQFGALLDDMLAGHADIGQITVLRV